MFTISVLSVSFLAAVSCKIKKVKAPVAAGMLWYLHLVFLFFSILCILLLLAGYGFKGIYTERVFFTLCAGSGMILYGLIPKDLSGKWAYLSCFYGFPFLLALGVLLPPLRILTVTLGVGLLADGDFKRYPIDDDLSLQTKSVSILYREPAYSLIQDKYWFFEKITADVVSVPCTAKDLKMVKSGKDSLRISLLKSTALRESFDTTISLQ